MAQSYPLFTVCSHYRQELEHNDAFTSFMCSFYRLVNIMKRIPHHTYIHCKSTMVVFTKFGQISCNSYSHGIHSLRVIVILVVISHYCNSAVMR